MPPGWLALSKGRLSCSGAGINQGDGARDKVPIDTISCINVFTFLGRRLEVREELQVPDHAPARVRHHPTEAVRGRQAAPRLRGHCGQRAREPEGGQAGGLLRQPGEYHVVSSELQVFGLASALSCRAQLSSFQMYFRARLQCNNNNSTATTTTTMTAGGRGK